MFGRQQACCIYTVYDRTRYTRSVMCDRYQSRVLTRRCRMTSARSDCVTDTSRQMSCQGEQGMHNSFAVKEVCGPIRLWTEIRRIVKISGLYVTQQSSGKRCFNLWTWSRQNGAKVITTDSFKY